MIPQEFKAKLEEMALLLRGETNTYGLYAIQREAIGDHVALSFMLGAEKAWELAVKTERERILKESKPELSIWAFQTLECILNPASKENE